MPDEKYKPIYPAYDNREFNSMEDLERFYTNLIEDKIQIDDILEDPMNLASDEKVTKLQTLLKRFGYNIQDNIPGAMDPTTTEAVKRFKNARVNEYNEDFVKMTVPTKTERRIMEGSQGG